MGTESETINVRKMSVPAAGLLAGILVLVSPAFSFSMDSVSDISLMDAEESDARLFFANYTSSLLAVNTTILLYALAAAAVVGAVVLALYLLANAPSRASGYGGYGYSDYDSYSRGFRSTSSGYDILTLISVASDLYGKISYGDVDCQKKIICEFMDKPEMFGDGAAQVKSGVQYATSWLAPLGFSIVDQISDAAMVDDEGGRNCEQRFQQCDKVSLTKTVAEKSQEVKNVKKGLTMKNTQEKVEEETNGEYEEYYYDEK